MFAFWRRMRREGLLAEQFPERYRTAIRDNVLLTRYLPAHDVAKLESLVRILVAEKNFEGAGGLELTEEMCVAIAARACLLILHRVEIDDPIYPGLDSIVVYPGAYRAKHVERDGMVVIEGEQNRLGESWTRGVVVLSWEAAVSGAAAPHDGHDVVLHEFAHQLDAQDGGMDGAPDLGASERYASWARVFGEEYQALREAVERGRQASIDAYATTNPAEFFAVVTEAFFEQPKALERRHPELYTELRRFYRLDPAALMRQSGSESADSESGPTG